MKIIDFLREISLDQWAFLLVVIGLLYAYLDLTVQAYKLLKSNTSLVVNAPGNIYSPVSWFIWSEIAAVVGYIAFKDASSQIVRAVILHGIIASFSLLIGIIGMLIFHKSVQGSFLRALLEERFNSHSKWRLLAFVLANLMLYVYAQAPDKTSFWVTVALMIADFCALMPMLLAIYAEPNESGASMPFFIFALLALLALWTVRNDNPICWVMPSYLVLANVILGLAIEIRKTGGWLSRKEGEKEKVRLKIVSRMEL